MKKFNEFIKSFFIWFIVFYLLLLVTDSFFASDKEVQKISEINIVPVSQSIVVGNLAEFTVDNRLSEKISFTSPCEKAGTLNIFRIVNNQQVSISNFEKCDGRTVPNLSIPSNSSAYFAFKDFNADTFSEEGKYQVEMKFSTENGNEMAILSGQVEFEEPGIFRQLFRALISKPLFNLLVFFTKNIPGHSFGWSIIILTVLVRILLFIPNQKAMRSQHELQRLQPKMEELKRKYGKNQQMMALKTMELYKTHKINPMSSCLPILFQMPFLIGIYFVVREGLSPHLDYLLYSFNKGVDLSVVDPIFLTMDLGKLPIWWGLPILVAGVQFMAMKLSFATAEKRKKATKSPTPEPEGIAGQMQQMQKMMLYFMPVMIGFFTATFPAAVGIYWFTSTVFGVIQQKVLYWQMDKPHVVRVKN